MCIGCSWLRGAGGGPLRRDLALPRAGHSRFQPVLLAPQWPYHRTLRSPSAKQLAPLWLQIQKRTKGCIGSVGENLCEHPRSRRRTRCSRGWSRGCPAAMETPWWARWVNVIFWQCPAALELDHLRSQCYLIPFFSWTYYDHTLNSEKQCGVVWNKGLLFFWQPSINCWEKILKLHYKIIYLNMWVLLAIILSNLFPVINQVPRYSSL